MNSEEEKRNKRKQRFGEISKVEDSPKKRLKDDRYRPPMFNSESVTRKIRVDPADYYNESYTIGSGCPLWDFTVESQVKAKDPIIKTQIPVAEHEYQRYLEVKHLRRDFVALCQDYLFVKPPPECFNRWLFEQLTTKSTDKKDSLLSLPSLAIESQVIKRELRNAIPAPTYLSWKVRTSASGVVQFIKEYANKCDSWLFNISRALKKTNDQYSEDMYITDDAKQKAKDILKNIDNWVNNKSFRATLEEAKDKLNSVSTKLLQILGTVVDSRIDYVCKKLSDETIISINYLSKIFNKKESIEDVEVTKESHNDMWLVKYSKDSIPVNYIHYIKLCTLYKLNSPEDKKLNHFHTCLYVLLRRYATFFGENHNEGTQFHAAAPSNVFQYMTKKFGVSQENFASPLNCYYKKFNSAFPDIDVYFGSLGSFFDFLPNSGSFETGPPYTEEVIYSMAKHVIHILSSTDEPLSFIVYVPDWQDPPTNGLVLMEKSEFLKSDFVVKGGQHQYVRGDQHKSKDRHFTLPFDTHVYILQNQKGNENWKPTEDKVLGLKEALIKF